MAGGKEYQNDLMVGYSPERSPPLGMKEGEKTRVGLHPMEGTGFSGILSGMRTITRIFSRLPAQRLSMLYDSVAVVVMGGAFLFMVAFTGVWAMWTGAGVAVRWWCPGRICFFLAADMITVMTSAVTVIGGMKAGRQRTGMEAGAEFSGDAINHF